MFSAGLAWYRLGLLWTIMDYLPNEKAPDLKQCGAFWDQYGLMLEEEEGFEPSVPFGTPDFESGTFDHSATLPDKLLRLGEAEILSGSQRLHSSQVGAQCFRYCHRTVSVLVVLQNRHQRAADGQAGAV
jgi:hypothetical protein